MVEADETGNAEVIPIYIPEGSTISALFKHLLRREGTDLRDDMQELFERLHQYKPAYDEAVKANSYPQFELEGLDAYHARRRRIQRHWAAGGTIMDLYRNDDECIDALDMLWPDFVRCFIAKTNPRHRSHVAEWEHDEWLRFETALLDDEPPTAALARELGIHRQTLANMMGFFQDA